MHPMRLMAWCLIVCYGVLPDLAVAANSFAVVGRTPGILAVQQSSEGPWRVVPVGGILPEVAEFRTSADGPVQIHINAGDDLFFTALSRVTYDRKARRIHLHSGGVFTSSPEKLGWTIVVGQVQIDVSGSKTEIILSSGDELRITALKGTANISVPGSAAVVLPERTTQIWRNQQPAGAATALTKDQETRLAERIKPLPPSPGPGQLLITDAQKKSSSRLAIARYHAELVLSPPVALVKLDQAFYNPYDRQEEGEFVFNLPPGASVSRFATYVTPDQLIEGEVIDRRQAGRVFLAIVPEPRNPASLEILGDNLFKMRVSQIPANDTKRILLDYTLPLDGPSVQYQIQLPIVSDLEPIWDFRIHGNLHGPTPVASVQSLTHPEIRFTKQGVDQIQWDFSRKHYRPSSDFLLAFQQSVPERPKSFRKFHAEPLKLKKDPALQEDGKFVVPDADGNIIQGKDPWNDLAATYFLAELPNPSDPASTNPADILVLIETSSSLKQIEPLRPALYTLIRNLRTQDRVRLVCVDAKPRPLHDGWLSAGTPDLKKALDNFEQQLCLGGNDLAAMFQSIAGQFESQADGAKTTSPQPRRRIVVYLGDGRDTVLRPAQVPAQKAAIQNAPRKQLAQICQESLAQAHADFWAVEVASIPQFAGTFTVAKPNFPMIGGGLFQIGPGPQQPNQQATATSINGRSLLKVLAESAGGGLFDVANKPLDQARYFEWILAGVPSSTSVAGVQVTSADPNSNEIAADVYFTPNPRPGEPLRITGRIAASTKLRIQYATKTANSAPAPQRIELTATGNSSDHLIGRYWAEWQFEYLNDIFSRANEPGGSPLALEAIVRLGREWSLLTPYTAFLMLEKEGEYATWGIDKQARREYWSDNGLPPVTPLLPDWVVENAPESVLKNYRIGPAEIRPLSPPEALKLKQARLKYATNALNHGHLDVAERVLALVRQNQLQDDPETLKLRTDLQKAREQVQALQQFGQRRAWFEQSNQSELPLGFSAMLATSTTIPPSFLKRHPHGEVLLREFNVPGGEMTLREFRNWVQTRTGISVQLDARHMEEESISLDSIITIPRMRTVTWFTVLRKSLDQMNLTYVEHPRQLEITTKTDGSGKRFRRFFGLQELLSPHPRFDLTELNDPLLDRQEAAEKRIEEKLSQIGDLKLTDATLVELVDEVKRRLHLNVVINVPKLEEESISTDAAQIVCDYASVPLGDALRGVLDTLNLSFAIKDEVLEITTKIDGAGRKSLRVYPALGLIHQSRVNRSKKPSWNGWMAGGSAGLPDVSRADGLAGSAGGASLRFGGIRFGSEFGDDDFGQPMGREWGQSSKEPSQPANTNVVADASPPPRIDPTTTTAVTTEPQEPEFDVAAAMLRDKANGTQPRGGPHFSIDADSHMTAIMTLTGGNDQGAPWTQLDGEGGDIGFFLPSVSYAIRQTPEAHTEIAEYFADLRDIQAKGGRNPNYRPLNPRHAVPPGDDPNPSNLMQLVTMLTGGMEAGAPWNPIDGEGGDLTWDEARYGLHVLQTTATLDDVNTLLLKLRRERYAALYKSRPWEKAGMDAKPGISLIPPLWDVKPAEAELPQQTPDAAVQATPEELELLKIRKPFTTGTWTWMDPEGRLQRSIELQRSSSGQLKLTWPGREIRVHGLTAATLAPRLKFAEIGPWGNVIREWLDVEIPLWPHRSNQELAELFEISLVPSPVPASPKNNSKPSSLQTLRFVPHEFRKLSTWIEITFDRVSGLPVEWVATTSGRITQQFSLTPEAARNESPATDSVLCISLSHGTGRWSPSTEIKPVEIPAPTDLPEKDFILFDRRPETTPKIDSTGISDLQQGKLPKAVRAFRATLEKNPNQPLIKFLLAWTLDRQGVVASLDEVRAAFVDAIQTGPPEFGHFLAVHGTRLLSTNDISELLSLPTSVPRNLGEEVEVATWMLNSGYPELAIEHAEAAWKLKPTLETERFDVIKLLIHCRLIQSDSEIALKWCQGWLNERPDRPLGQIRQLLDLFRAEGSTDLVIPIYSQLLNRPDVHKLPDNQRRELLIWHAEALAEHTTHSATRWASLLTACELLQAPKSPQSQNELSELIAELGAAPEATPEVIAKLIEQSQIPQHRQELLSVLADRTSDPVQATTTDWKLHQSGFTFPRNLSEVLRRMNQSNQFDKSVALAESRLRTGHGLSSIERELLAEAYLQLQQPDAAKRARSTP